MQSNTEQINYWVIPGKQTIKQFAEFVVKPPPECVVSIFPISGVISFYKGAALLVGLKEGNSVAFVVIDEMVFVHKAHKGTKLWLADNRFLRTKATRFVNEIATKFGARQSFKCKIERTETFFNGIRLYKLVMPRRYYKTFKLKQTI